MGLHDRDYMQAERLGLAGSLQLRTTWARLVLLNMVVFLLWQVTALQPLLAGHFMVSGAHVVEGRVWTLVTYSVSHMDFLHLLWNMLFLWWFGRDLEVIYGGRNLFALYLFAGVGAALGQLGLNAVWGDPRVPTLGASGAVLGIVVATAMFYPHRRLWIWGLVPVPLWLLAGIFIVSDLSGALYTIDGGASGVAHGAHLGGALAGAAFKAMDLRPFSAHSAEALVLGPGVVARARRGLSGRHELVPLDDRGVEPPVSSPPAPVEEASAFSDRVDDVLRKINSEGLASLSDAERALLDEASERYRRV